MAEHAPAPWRIGVYEDTKEYIFDSEGVAVAKIKQKARVEANTCLIAAAPDMLEALLFLDKHVTQLADKYGDDATLTAGTVRACIMAREAIAKAKGIIMSNIDKIIKQVRANHDIIPMLKVSDVEGWVIDLADEVERLEALNAEILEACEALSYPDGILHGPITEGPELDALNAAIAKVKGS